MEGHPNPDKCLICCGVVDVYAILDCCSHIHCILCMAYYWHITKPNVRCCVCKERIKLFVANDCPVPHGSAQKTGLLRRAYDMDQLMPDAPLDFIITECDAGIFMVIYNSAQMKVMFPSRHFRSFFDENARQQIPETRLYKTFTRRRGAEIGLHPALVMNRTTKYKFVALVGRATDHTEYTEIVATRDGLLWLAIYDKSYKPEES